MLSVNIGVVFLLVGATFTRANYPSSCLNITGVDYDFYKGVGLWYIYASTNDPYGDSLRCLTHYWNYPTANNSARVIAAGISKKTGSLSETEAVFTMNKPDNRLHAESWVPLLGKVSYDCWDLEDIYDDYIITSSCKRQGSKIVPTFTIITREPYPTTDVIGRARHVITNLGFADPHFVIFDTNCN